MHQGGEPSELTIVNHWLLHSIITCKVSTHASVGDHHCNVWPTCIIWCSHNSTCLSLWIIIWDHRLGGVTPRPYSPPKTISFLPFAACQEPSEGFIVSNNPAWLAGCPSLLKNNGLRCIRLGMKQLVLPWKRETCSPKEGMIPRWLAVGEMRISNYV